MCVYISLSLSLSLPSAAQLFKSPVALSGSFGPQSWTPCEQKQTIIHIYIYI